MISCVSLVKEMLFFSLLLLVLKEGEEQYMEIDFFDYYFITFHARHKHIRLLLSIYSFSSRQDSKAVTFMYTLKELHVFLSTLKNM